MATPNWSKLPALIEDLIAHAPQYELFAALAAVERAWAERGTVGDGLDRWLRVEPYPALAFPPADLRGGYIDEAGVLRLTANVHGLYGVDAPTPHYLLEAADRQDDVGARFRAFLDMFNHRLYSLLYQAWKLQSAVDGSANSAYAGVTRALAGGAGDDRLAHAGRLGRRRLSAAGLAAILAADLDTPVTVADGIPQWLAVSERPGLGAGTGPCLGDDALLGDCVQVAGERVDVRIGPVALVRALALLPGTRGGDRLLTLVRGLLGVDVPFDLVLRVRASSTEGATLGGGTLPLGWACWLGERLDEENIIRITAGRERPATTH